MEEKRLSGIAQCFVNARPQWWLTFISHAVVILMLVLVMIINFGIFQVSTNGLFKEIGVSATDLLTGFFNGSYDISAFNHYLFENSHLTEAFPISVNCSIHYKDRNSGVPKR